MTPLDICIKNKNNNALEQSPNHKLFIHFFSLHPTIQHLKMEYTQCMQSIGQLLQIHNLYSLHVFLFISGSKHTCKCAVLCYLSHHRSPQIEKYIHSVCARGLAGDTAGLCACVCVCVSGKKKSSSLCVRSLCSASPQPIILQGKELWASSFQSPHSHLRCFPMPAVIFHILVYLARDLDFHRFLFFTWSGRFFC